MLANRVNVRCIRCICALSTDKRALRRIRVLTDLNRQTGRPCFVRARATAPTKSGIFPISRLLMRLDVRMSNLFYWMYTLAPTVPRHRLVEHRSASSRQGNRLTRKSFTPSVGLRFSPLFSSIIFQLLYPLQFIYCVFFWFIRSVKSY